CRAALLCGFILVAACARPVGPSGGPRDVIPPMIASTWPDTFATIEPTRDPVKIVFSERISERPTEGRMNNAVLVSPFTGEQRVKHTRSGLEIDVIGGFQPNLVYRIRVLPTLKDLFNNTLEGPFELVFSTGPAFETNVVAGIVKERITGEASEGVRVEARARGQTDPPVYIAVSDSVGVFALRYLPAGAYDLSLYQDVNRNTEPDYRELQGRADSLVLGLGPAQADTILLREVSLLTPDTTPSRLIRVESVDSLLVRFEFDDYMDAEASLDSVQVMIAPEGGEALPVARLMWPRQVDSLQAVADSVAREEQRIAMMDSLQVVADSLSGVLAGVQAAGDTVAADSLGAMLEQIMNRLAPPEEPEEPPPGAPAPGAPTEPPPVLPQQEFFVRMEGGLPPDELLQAVIGRVVNINGLGGGGGEASFTWEPPDPPAEEVQDTAALQPDTATVTPPDTGSAFAPESGRVVTPVVTPETGAAGSIGPAGSVLFHSQRGSVKKPRGPITESRPPGPGPWLGRQRE
ncbi:MAG: Ig-like domain-containing protein, partial [Gemmatimonadetes bacterium]|nr:Ig-like domain-containing protein [Gemmatimonadota bacterium]